MIIINVITDLSIEEKCFLSGVAGEWVLAGRKQKYRERLGKDNESHSHKRWWLQILLGWRQDRREMACLRGPCLKLYMFNISNSQKTILTSEIFVHIDLPQKNPVPWKLIVSPLEENYRHEYMGAM